MATGQASRGFLARLRRDRGGNTLTIVAAALIPLCAMIGSGVDMSRAYLARNRLRQACDAGALAGRRLLTTTQVTDAVRTEATNYFRFNFPTGTMQAAPYTLDMSVPQAGTLAISTSTTIPTTIMKMFGYDTLSINAECRATQDFINTDIMMVFDLSGSMNCAPGGAGDCGGTEQPGSKIQALRDAAISFYDTLKTAQDQLHANSLRMRYGFVNYNSTVNVGRLLYAHNPNYMVQNWHYQSRWPTEPINAAPFGVRDAGTCNNAYTYDSVAQSMGYSGVKGGYWNRPTAGGCLVFGTRLTDPNGYTFGKSANWNVEGFMRSTTDQPFDASVYIGTPDGDERPLPVNTVWNGCIEERDTNSTLIDGGSSTAAPADAYDLDVDLLPSNDATRWRPMWPDVSYYPEWVGSDTLHLNSGCPTEARRLREYYEDRPNFVSYINGLRVGGSTYHDLGIIWGARFISPTGIFRATPTETNDLTEVNNPTKVRGFSVKKYMIFMTDGDMAPTSTVYSAYGVEALDGRVMGSPSYDQNGLTQRHLQRFRMACNAAKAKGIDVWVVAFATTLTDDMKNCASKATQAAGLSTRDQLIAKFQEIGTKIGSLRLSR
jgi:Flp pilus assembly protein TadG